MQRAQGQKLPEFTQCNGEWIEKPAVFFYHSSIGQGPVSARLPMYIEFKDGSCAVGVDAEQLAAEMGVNIADLIDANHSGALQFLGVVSTDPRHGGTKALAYASLLGNYQGNLTIED